MAKVTAKEKHLQNENLKLRQANKRLSERITESQKECFTQHLELLKLRKQVERYQNPLGTPSNIDCDAENASAGRRGSTRIGVVGHGSPFGNTISIMSALFGSDMQEILRDTFVEPKRPDMRNFLNVIGEEEDKT